jgi:hypothetical protein
MTFDERGNMDIVVALIGLAIVVLVAVYVAQPLVTRTRVKVSADESPRDKLLAERDALYAAIRDLDFDFQTGKLLEVDYRAARGEYTACGVEILKELDALGAGRGRQEARGKGQEVAADEIEAAVQARRKHKAETSEDAIEAAIRSRRQAANRNPEPPKEGDSETLAPALRASVSAGVQNQKCPNCGRPVDLIDRFCAKCGTALIAEATR